MSLTFVVMQYAILLAASIKNLMMGSATFHFPRVLISSSNVMINEFSFCQSKYVLTWLDVLVLTLTHPG